MPTAPPFEPALYPDRNVMHRNMGAPEAFPCCGGRGIGYELVPGTEDDYIPDAREVYCSCAAGAERRRVEAGT